MANPAAITERPARECDCPDYVMRCVHVGDTLVLVNDCTLSLRHGAHHRTARYLSWTLRGVMGRSRCFTCDEPDVIVLCDRDASTLHYKGDSEADALAAFYAAEEALRGEA